MKKIIVIFSLLFSILNASVTVQTSKSTYAPQEEITVNLTGMLGHNLDWIGIYPVESTNAWENVVKWDWTGGITEGSVTLEKVPVGNYEVRAFFENSFNLEGAYPFSVEGDALDVNVSATKRNYLPKEEVVVNFSHMLGDTEDWIGIYPEGSTNDWGNVIAWNFTNGVIDGNMSFPDLEEGNYSVRAFFKNSFNLEANSSFSIQNEVAVEEVTLHLNKNVYAQNELVYVQYDHMQGNTMDWLGIYPKGSSYHFENVIEQKYTDGKISGEMALGGYPQGKVLHGSTPMPGLAVGEYEIRAFFNDTLHAEKVASFSVVEKAVVSTVYEDANGSISEDWIHVSGPYPPAYYNGVVRLRAKWVDNHTNTSEYILPLSLPNTTQNVLELDVGGEGRWTPHFNVGVIVQTVDGRRRMLWDSFLNHYDVSANKQGNVLSYPTYVELQRNTADSRKHFRVNLDKYLKVLEPDNKILSVTDFFATGGDLDNIKLSSH
jgi:hypothetical protein